MPIIEIRDWMGQSRRCESSNPYVLAYWLLEQASELCNMNAALGPLQMSVWPRWVQVSPDRRPEQDWLQGTRNVLIGSDDLLSLSNLLAVWLAEHEKTDA